MFKSSSSRLVSRTGASAIFAIAMSLSNIAASQAMSITPDSVNPWQHIVDCWGAMVAGDPVHATDCSPGQPGPNTTLVTPVPGGGSGSPPCNPVKETLAKPVFSTYDVASLDDSIASSGTKGANLDIHTAATCGSPCPPVTLGGLKAFSSYDLASLDDSIMPRSAIQRGDSAHVAACEL